MTYDEIKQFAWNGASDEDIDKMVAPEYTCYQGLLYLCNSYKKELINQDQLKSQSIKIQKNFEYYNAAFIANVKNNADWINNTKQSEPFRVRITKTSDIKEIAICGIEALSLMTGDESFKENLKKVEGNNEQSNLPIPSQL